MSFHVIIPARWASSRLPGKMLADLGGLPMVVRVAQQAKQTPAKSITIATDDERILTAAKAHDVDCVMTHAKHPTGTDRLAQAAELLALASDEIVVNVQGDEPLIDPALIEMVAQSLQTDTEADIATCASPIAHSVEMANPNIVKVVCDTKGHALYFSRAAIPYTRDAGDTKTARNNAPILHHIGLYAYRVHFLRAFPQLTQGLLEAVESLEQLRALEHGFKIRVNVVDEPSAGGVDTSGDLLRVQQSFK